jgi:deoxyribodipyrimidine photo-lyase
MAAVATVTSILIYLLRRDLRLSDNPVFCQAAKEYSTECKFTHFLPIYVFSAQQIEVSGFLKSSDPPHQPSSPYPEARSQVARYWRCGPHRAKFLAESVWDLKECLERAESGLVIRAGLISDIIQHAFDHFEKPKDEAHSTQAGRAEIVGVWMTGDVTAEERQEELEIQRIVEGHGKEFRLFTDEKFFVDEYDHLLAPSLKIACTTTSSLASTIYFTLSVKS